MQDNKLGLVARWSGTALVAAVVAWCTISTPYANSPPSRSDGVVYHAWTKAILEWDFSFCSHVQDMGAEQFSSLDYKRGRCQLRYPPGLALLQLPVMAFLVKRGPGEPFISPAEHAAALVIAAIALILVAALITDASRRLGARPGPTAVAVTTGVLGTGLLHYATYDASFTHIYSALGFSLLLWLGARGAQQDLPLAIAPLFLIGFFLVLLRSTNVLLLSASALVAFAALRPDGTTWRDRRCLFRAIRNAAPAAAGALGGEIIQLTYNYYATGHFALSSYGPATFHLEARHQLQVLWSYERGLLTWYPWVGVAVAVALLSRRVRPFGSALLGLIGVYATLYGFWQVWCLGGGFGHRGFVDIMPAAILSFAVALDGLGRAARTAAIAAGLLAAAITLELLAGYWRHTIDYTGTTSRIYWAHVLGKDSLLPIPLLKLDRGVVPRGTNCE